MARRRELSGDGDDLFVRTDRQWQALGAPDFVRDLETACEAYAEWAPNGVNGARLDELTRTLLLRRVRVGGRSGWLRRCVRPMFLISVDALTAAEIALLTDERSARWWGPRPGECFPQLAPDAPVPDWLASCRRSSLRGPARVQGLTFDDRQD